MATDLEERTKPVLSNNDGDHERFAHYVDKGKSAEAYVLGTELTALCGKVWIPTRDPKNYPICPECAEIYENVPDSLNS